MIYKIYDVMMSVNTCDRMYFWIFILSRNSLTHETWSIDKYKQEKYFSEIFWTIWRTRAKFQALQFSNLLQLLNNELCQVSSASFYWMSEQERIKNGKYQLLKIDRSTYIIISLKSWKGLELVSSLQYWAKNMLEIIVIRYTSIWPNFIFIARSI